jgi:hypothetical protein
MPLDTDASNTATGWIASAPPGRYLLRLDLARPAPAVLGSDVTVEVERGGATVAPLVPALLWPFAIPVILFLIRSSFEHRRWQDSDHAG